MTEITEIALQKAQSVLESECSPIGLMASPEGSHVWARDSVITSLGALLSPGHENCLGVSLVTLAEQQSELGAIPNNVSVVTGRLDHTNAGSVDSNLWFILGHLFHQRQFGDVDFLRLQWPTLEKAILWLRYQDSNGCGLLEVHEAADWADLLANRFNILYDNVLWYAALRAMAEMSRSLGLDGEHFDEMADDVRHKIRIVLWVGVENEAEWRPDCPGHTEWKHTLSQVDPVLVKRPFFLPYVAFRDFGDYCDVFGNLLAILFGVANPAQEKRILDYMHQVGIAEPYPVRVLHPIIHPGNKDWREYYRNNNLNLPEQYHNGGHAQWQIESLWRTSIDDHRGQVTTADNPAIKKKPTYAEEIAHTAEQADHSEQDEDFHQVRSQPDRTAVGRQAGKPARAHQRQDDQGEGQNDEQDRDRQDQPELRGAF